MSFYSANDAIYGSGEYGTASYDVVTPIISLASVSATGQITAVNTTITKVVTGISGTGQIGTATAVNDSSLTLGSVSATGQVNTVFENPSEAITGVSATGSIGTVFAQAFFGANDALYGTGRYGSAIYGDVSPTINFPTFQLVGTIQTVQVGGQFEVDVSERLSSVSATGVLGQIQVIPKLIDSVSATGALGTIKPNLTEPVLGLSATGSIGTLTHSNTHRIASVVGTFTLDKGNRPFAKAFTFQTATAVSATGAIGTISPNVDEPVSGVLGTGAVGTPEITTLEALSSVVATGGIGTLTHSNTHSLGSVQATTTVEPVQVDGFEIDVQERLNSVFATGVINGTITHSNTHRITSAIGTSIAGIITATGVTFNFVANDYDRKRVVYVPRQDTAAERRAAA